MSAAPTPPRWVVHGQGVAQVPTLTALLSEATLVSPWAAWRHGADAVLAWGQKPSAQRAQSWATRRGLPVLRIEDGFLRSIGLGPDDPPLSLVWDDAGIYYDARHPSRLERLIAAGTTAAEAARAEALRQAWRAARVSKYNHAREADDPEWAGAVLVVDQTWGDASITCGQAGPEHFARMLRAALAEHPDRLIVLKVHPDVIAGRKRGHFDAVLPQLSAADRARIRWLGRDVHPPALLERVAAMYVVTSQMGFEALLWGVPVRCFGLPFYAGWGLTSDDQPAPARRSAATLDSLVHAALIAYPRYVHPETGQRCDIEPLLDWFALQRQQRTRFAPEVIAAGFSLWKRPIVRRFLAGSRVTFQSRQAPVPAGSTVVLWGRQPLPPGGPAATVVRMEDGFLRSVGLGAALVQPQSWVQDRRGIYYDGDHPSDIEHLLQTADFPPALCARAAALRERILAQGATKYNLSGTPWQRPAAAQGRDVVLVVGQVESDASLRHGSPRIRSNLALIQAARQAHPRAWLIYKPHPDVVAKLRSPGSDEHQAAQHCDEVLPHARMDTLLRQVDTVHVMTSLAGFEALLRGRRVVCWGRPFYSGWGLTDDRLDHPQRQRALSLDALTAATLILYPTYLSQRTRRFTTPERTLDELRDQTPPAPLVRGLHAALTHVLRLWVALKRR
ncbi:capsular biosynthesis protein [Vitreoscilla filiformis]|uniref:Capsular biosynthesis protein n=1 Tax=Vitreoscilla filiformis TaxID=63 RepID=A0A221KD31_VITFI|nr:capsular polysaccharide biosynthesis protein [Vitreoscilla filiformis]ASM76869.1 capsular biosynthesis protein [Vitreoscilla filiformis]